MDQYQRYKYQKRSDYIVALLAVYPTVMNLLRHDIAHFAVSLSLLIYVIIAHLRLLDGERP